MKTVTRVIGLALVALTFIAGRALADWDVTVHIDDLHVIADTDGLGAGDPDITVFVVLRNAEPFWAGNFACGAVPTADEQPVCAHPHVCRTFFAPHFDPKLIRWTVWDVDFFGYEIMTQDQAALAGPGPWVVGSVGPSASISMTVSKVPTTCGREYKWCYRTLPDHAMPGQIVPAQLVFHIPETRPINLIQLDEFLPYGFQFLNANPPPTQVQSLPGLEGTVTKLSWRFSQPQFTTVTIDYSVRTPMDPQLVDGVFAQQIVENGNEITYSLTGNDHAFIGSNVLAVPEEAEEAPSLEPHMLGTPTPTPTSDQATFTVDLPFAAEVEIAVYDACGRMVRSLVDRELNHGKHTFSWDTKSSEGDPVASGAYYLRLTLKGGTVREIQRIIVTR